MKNKTNYGYFLVMGLILFLFFLTPINTVFADCQGQDDCADGYSCDFDSDGTGFCTKDEPSCTPHTSSCSASCAGQECGSDRGTKTRTYSDCDTRTISCSKSCGSCPSDYYHCDSDLSHVLRRDYYCSGGSCNYNDEEDEYCNKYDGDYCANSNTLEERNYYCSGGDCNNYNIEDQLSCSSTYGDRSFCASYGTYGENSDCESYPEATSLEWNLDDHNYDFSLHGTDSYPYCGESEPPAVNLSWDYSSQTNDSYTNTDLQVSEVSDFSSTVVDVSLGGTESYTIPITLDFNQDYYWRVRVRDDNTNWSNDGGYSWSQSTFRTDKKRCDVDFTYTPPQPFVDERVDFVNETTPGDVSISSWDWTFQNGDPNSSTQENPSTEFTTEGNNDTNLQATDSENVICSQTKKIDTRLELPVWQEVNPFD